MRTLIATSFLLAVAGCSTDPAPPPEASGEDHLEAAPLDVVSIAERSECVAGNGGSSVEAFVPASFDAAAVMADLKASNRDRGCGGHATSTSREDGVAIFKAFLAEQADTFQSNCEDDAVPDALTRLNEEMIALVEDPTNLGVFSTVPATDSNDDPVSCYYFRFDVYRADGALVSFDFDWGD